MHKRIATVVSIAAVLSLGLAGTASAGLLKVSVAPAGVGYDSDGTFEGLADVVDQICAAAGQQDLVVAEGLSASVCVPRPVDEGQLPGANGSELLTADLGAVPLAGIGFGSDGFFGSFQHACELGALIGFPVEEQTVEVAPGVSVTAC
jgi:hypothetical protein